MLSASEDLQIFRKKFAGSWTDETAMINWYNHLRFGFVVMVSLVIMLMVEMMVIVVIMMLIM